MKFSDWSAHPPRTTGFYIFRGLRVTGSGRVSELYEPVEIVYTFSGKRKELQPLCMYAGEWQELALREPVAGLVAFVEAT